MATSLEFIEYVHEQSELGQMLSYRKMFGEYALYIEGKVVALACDNSLYVKPTQSVQKLVKLVTAKAPYPGAKPHLIIDELLDDSESLKGVLLAAASDLPAPKPPKKRSSR